MVEGAGRIAEGQAQAVDEQAQPLGRGSPPLRRQRRRVPGRASSSPAQWVQALTGSRRSKKSMRPRRDGAGVGTGGRGGRPRPGSGPRAAHAGPMTPGGLDPGPHPVRELGCGFLQGLDGLARAARLLSAPGRSLRAVRSPSASPINASHPSASVRSSECGRLVLDDSDLLRHDGPAADEVAGEVVEAHEGPRRQGIAVQAAQPQAIPPAPSTATTAGLDPSNRRTSFEVASQPAS